MPKKPLQTESRDKVVSIRLSARSAYLAELGAHLSNRSLSAFVEWCVQFGLERVKLNKSDDTIASRADDLWHTHESVRVAVLAELCPAALTFEQRAIWDEAAELPALRLRDERHRPLSCETMDRSAYRYFYDKALAESIAAAVQEAKSWD